MSAQADSAQPTPKRALRRLVADSVLTGLCPLIPVPLLDDFARDLLRTRLVSRLAAAVNSPLADADARILACGYRPPSAGGCARGCLRAAVVKPTIFLSTLIFRKIMRKVLFFLTVKDAVDTFSETFHQAYLLRHALSAGLMPVPTVAHAAGDPAPGQPAPDPRLLEVRAAVEGVVRNTDTRPVTTLARSIFAGSRRLAVRTARGMTRVLRRRRQADEAELTERLEQEAEVGLGGLIDELTRDLEMQGGYLERLEAALETRLT